MWRPLAVLALCGCGTAPRVAPTVGAPQAPAVELVETVPVETTLDHPELRDASAVWLEMIDGARSTIDLAEFYVSNTPDGKLEPIIAALEAALHRGVRVRLLVESSFVKTYPDTLARLAHSGTTVRALDLSKTTHGILHAKYFVIDDRVAFFGSQNFDWRALEHNYELGARVRDPSIVAGLGAIFAGDWARAGGETAADLHPPKSALVASPRSLLPVGIAWDLPALVAGLDGAHHTISFEALTYAAGAWDELEAPLLRAAARGVHVELMLADWSKRPGTLPGLQRLARTPNVAIRLVTISAWSGGFIPYARVTHAKLLVVDGTHGWLGTGNWERDYFYASRNVGLVIDDPGLAEQLQRFFRSAWDSPYATPLDPDASYLPPRIE